MKTNQAIEYYQGAIDVLREVMDVKEGEGSAWVKGQLVIAAEEIERHAKEYNAMAAQMKAAGLKVKSL